MKRLIKQPHVIFSVENPAHPKEAIKASPTHQQALDWLKGQGETVIDAKGQYGAPENSIIVSNPKNIENIQKLAQDIGQESMIYSNGVNHEMRYLSGPQKGKVITGQGTAFHPSQPKDNYTHFKDQNGNSIYFTHNFNFGKSEELDKGAKGDWQKEGVYLQVEPFDDNETFEGFHPKKHSFMIAAYKTKEDAKNRGELIGYTNLLHDEKTLYPHSIQVHPDYRRKGIATAMYKMAEKASGKKIKMPDTGEQSKPAKKLWAQPNRPFGKSEELDKGAKGDWEKEKYKIQHVGNPSGDFDVFAISPKGETVGKVSIGRYETKTKPNLIASNPTVHKDHRRKGIASAMYQYAEKISGGVMKPDTSLTLSAKQMWAKPSRPFGGKRKYFQHLSIKSAPTLTKSDVRVLTKGFEDLFALLAKAKKNIVYIATDGDNIGASVERAALSNDIKEIKKQDKIIKKGNQVIRKWINERKGSIYIDGGDDISFTIHKKYLDEIEDLRNKYHEATGYTITVGVGDSISEAAHAMIYGKLKGKNQVNKWTPEIESIISQHDKKPETAEEKYQKEGLLAIKPNK